MALPSPIKGREGETQSHQHVGQERRTRCLNQASVCFIIHSSSEPHTSRGGWNSSDSCGLAKLASPLPHTAQISPDEPHARCLLWAGSSSLPPLLRMLRLDTSHLSQTICSLPVQPSCKSLMRRFYSAQSSCCILDRSSKKDYQMHLSLKSTDSSSAEFEITRCLENLPWSCDS